MRREPVKRGAYAVIVRADRRTRVRVGRLGPLQFKQGAYVYVGSAMNSLRGRVSRYFIRSRKKHWHIDYLLHNSTFKSVGLGVKVTSRKIECEISNAVQREAVSSVKGFGCSDCNCESHLHYFSGVPAAYQTLSQLGLEIIPRI